MVVRRHLLVGAHAHVGVVVGCGRVARGEEGIRRDSRRLVVVLRVEKGRVWREDGGSTICWTHGVEKVVGIVKGVVVVGAGKVHVGHGLGGPRAVLVQRSV